MNNFIAPFFCICQNAFLLLISITQPCVMDINIF